MKKLTTFLLAMVLTLSMSVAASANPMGMDFIGDYEWSYNVYQMMIDETGTPVDLSGLDYTNPQDVLDSLQGNSIWGIVDMTEVYFQGTDPDSKTWRVVGDTFVEPNRVVGAIYGLEFLGMDPVTGQLLWGGGNAQFYSASAATVAAPASFLGDVPTDEAGFLTWFEAEYPELVDGGELFNAEWTPGVYDGEYGYEDITFGQVNGEYFVADASGPIDPTDVTQVSEFTSANVGAFTASGHYYASADNSSPFGNILDSDKFCQEVDQTEYCSDILGNAQTTNGVDGWTFQSTTAGAQVHAVPEPSTFLLIGAGLVGCFFYTRRRKNA